jgi:hypothetical protein
MPDHQNGITYLNQFFITTNQCETFIHQHHYPHHHRKIEVLRIYLSRYRFIYHDIVLDFPIIQGVSKLWNGSEPYVYMIRIIQNFIQNVTTKTE